MAIALVAHASSVGSNGTTTSAINTTGASLLVAFVGFVFNNAAVISDSYGNTWTPLTFHLGVNNCTTQIFYVQNPTVGTGHTFSETGTSTYPALSVAAFSGTATSSVFDVQNGTNPVGATTFQPGSVTPSQNNSLIVTGFDNDQGSSAQDTTINSGFTITDQNGYGFGVNEGGGLAYLVQTTAAPVNPTWTMSTAALGAGSAIAVFKPAAGSPGALTGSASATSTATGTLAGRGALTGSASATSSASGALIGKEPITGAASAVSAATGSLTGKGALSASASATSVATGTLTGKGALTGTAGGTSAAAGTLTGVGALTGSASATSSASGTLGGGAPGLSGSASATSAASGTLTGKGALVGSASATSGAAGSLIGKAPITGSASAAFSASGTLVAIGALAGSASASSGVSAALSGVGALVGSATASFAVSGRIVGLAAISAAASAISSAVGTLTAGSARVVAIVLEALAARAIRVSVASRTKRISPSATAIRIARATALSTNVPIRLDVMREGATDTRGLDLTLALQVEADTIASISSVTVSRRDGVSTGQNDLAITPFGFLAPWIAANSAGIAGKTVNWWQSAGASIAATAPVDYQITVSFTTVAGRQLSYDAYQMVTPTIG